MKKKNKKYSRYATNRRVLMIFKFFSVRLSYTLCYWPVVVQCDRKRWSPNGHDTVVVLVHKHTTADRRYPAHTNMIFGQCAATQIRQILLVRIRPSKYRQSSRIIHIKMRLVLFPHNSNNNNGVFARLVNMWFSRRP